MKKEKSVRLSKGLGKYFIIPVLVLWLFSMWLLTWAACKHLYAQLEKGATAWEKESQRAYWSIKQQVPGATEHYMLEQILYGGHFLDPEPLLPIVYAPGGGLVNSEDAHWEIWEQFRGYQAAMGYYDANGEKILASGDFLHFPYYLDSDFSKRGGYTYIDLETLPGGNAFADQYISQHPFGDRSPFDRLSNPLYYPIKLVGHFEGNRFVPSEISYNRQILYASEEAVNEAETIYATDFTGCNLPSTKPFSLNGITYENTAALLDSDAESSFSLLNAVIVRQFSVGRGAMSCRIAVRCCPLTYAVLQLFWVYVITFLLTVLCIYLLWRRIRSTLIYPLTSMTDDLVVGRIPPHYFSASPFAELQELRDNIHAVQKDRQQTKNQVQQLQTALNYAKNAEESRRKLLSAMAHELKTPLAVLQSYAEGLQSGIAAEKQEKYLSVIREETAHMDAMVLEMLEFSRLEAGKVQLQLQPVSLPDLTQRIFEKLEAAAQKKQLKIAFDMPEEFTVQADEARISQVITNFASNAVKYTPDGGSIRVSLSQTGSSARFAIENDSPPLSQEALEQVWDSFYRADTARDRSGTGLGLSIAKSIVELHRGRCGVKNTPSGVEFHFRIPL